MQSINCNGKLIDLSVPKVMGILNVTPDSFYDGGKFKDIDSLLSQVDKMLQEGATFIDIGAYSTRPNARHIEEQEELSRIEPILKAIFKEFPETPISIDTFRSTIAKACVELGASMINDISGGTMDSAMFQTIAELQVPYVLMHIQGTPQTMQQSPKYVNIVTDLLDYFSKKVNELRTLKVNDIIIDVGFGFGKTLEQNYDLLKSLHLFERLGLPMLTGISRKSMLYKLLDTTPDNALNATTAANTIALLNGASILRVHDVKEAMEAIQIVQATLK